MVLAPGTGCGSQRIADYLAEHCSNSAGSSESGELETADSTGARETGSSGSTGTDEGPGTAGTSTGAVEGSSAADTTMSATSTGEPLAECGNGVLEPFAAVPEECDDGNLDPEDGCGATCAVDRRAFVTSVLYRGGDFKSLKQADARCANLADDQGWPDGLSYRAWLSDSTSDARDRVVRGRGRLVLANGLVLAESWSALLGGQLENALEVTEKSETYHGGVWTGTRPDGTAVPGAEHCEDWTTESVLPLGHFGYSDRTMGEWTLADDPDQPINCNLEFALYCFQSL